MDYKITMKDCEFVVREITQILTTTLSPYSFDFIVYGSYANGNWRDGLSDLDGILYFNKNLFARTISTRELLVVQLKIRDLYNEIPFLKKKNFFSDVFILDKFHGDDGRFMIYDKNFIQRLLVVNKNYSVAWGNNFLSSLYPVSLRHQEEFQMAMYLQEVRKFLIFEIPRLSLLTTRREIPEVYKFVKALPRFVHIIIGEPINSIKEGLDALCKRFPDINYDPLYELEKAEREGSKKLRYYLKTWCTLSSPNFTECWFCYEKTLECLVLHSPMRSIK
ncbi:MAG: nucleotidyltransferase domain-containing protein [bacterium]|nr:nucleotidyltransferase domain-containing protein [bacterium]